jgi:hypothetical protein
MKWIAAGVPVLEAVRPENHSPLPRLHFSRYGAYTLL